MSDQAETNDVRNPNALNQTSYNSIASNLSKGGEARPLIDAEESPKKVVPKRNLRNKINLFGT